ncbi:unnamed protein product [Ambrosiozyma monospora]|uniref:Unnamed protein product n=1 Tax=Ambrosiozyma monospora TaxID=43982 RepID=A0ACB5UCK5_AMBMO|nr:unnamed protein product [Ambrosiozyma monospora]
MYAQYQPQVSPSLYNTGPSYMNANVNQTPQVNQFTTSDASVLRKRYQGGMGAQSTLLGAPIRDSNINVSWWEEEKIPCYEVELNGVTVLRRSDNNYINATKLLNSTHMTRGKRDGILKSELNKKIVRKGPMKFMGIWLPLQKAEIIAKREGIRELLFPLFERDVGKYVAK